MSRQRTDMSRTLEVGRGSASLELSTPDVEEEAVMDKPSTVSCDENTVSSTKYSDLALSSRRILLLIMAVAIRSIPEGLALAVGFASIRMHPGVTRPFDKAFDMAVYIGVSYVFSGLAVSLPLTGYGYSKLRASLYGQTSGFVGCCCNRRCSSCAGEGGATQCLQLRCRRHNIRR